MAALQSGSFDKYETNDDLAKEEDKTTKVFSAFGLYKYQDNSLSLVVSSLLGDEESALQTWLSRRLARGYTATSGGNIASFGNSGVGNGDDQSKLCYYRVFNPEPKDDILGPLEADSSILGPLEADSSSHNEASDPGSSWVIFFLAHNDLSIDLFKPELDKYSSGVTAFLDNELLLDNPKDILEAYLGQWRDQAIDYLMRAVRLLASQLKYMLHAALLGQQVMVESEDSSIKRDILLLNEICGFGDLLNEGNKEGPAGSDTDDGVVLLDLPVSDPLIGSLSQPLTLTVTKDTCTCHPKVSECTQFCEEWAMGLLNNGSDNPVVLRRLIENYRLRAIQDMNKLKRLIEQANTDHYALFRSYIFLRNSGNAQILLEHTKKASETRDVLNVLQDYLNVHNTSCGR